MTTHFEMQQVKLVLQAQVSLLNEMMGSCNCRPYVSKLPTLTYNNSDIGTFLSFVYICFTDVYPIIKGKGQDPVGSMSQVVGLPNISYKPIINTAWVRARLCLLQKGCTRLAAASDKAYQLLAHGRWLYPGRIGTTNSGILHQLRDIYTTQYGGTARMLLHLKHLLCSKVLTVNFAVQVNV